MHRECAHLEFGQVLRSWGRGGADVHGGQLLADLAHELCVVPVLFHGPRAVRLDVVKHRLQLGIVLELHHLAHVLRAAV